MRYASCRRLQRVLSEKLRVACMQSVGDCRATPVLEPPVDQGRIRATTMMAPQMVRALAAGQAHVFAEPSVAAACTVWALAVCLFFLRRGRWPFSPEQIRQWAATPEAEWNDDVLLARAPSTTGAAPNSVFEVRKTNNHPTTLPASNYRWISMPEHWGSIGE